MHSPAWLIRFAVVALMLALARPAHAQTFNMRYEAVAYGLFSFGRASIDATMESDRYDASASLRTSGLAALVTKARADATSRGGFSADSGMAPARYNLDHEHYGHRVTSVDWSQTPVVMTAAPTFRFPGDPAPTEEQRRTGRDPLATLLSMGAHVGRTGHCKGVFRVFDGLYVYDLTLRDLGDGRFDRNGRNWPVVRCALRQTRIAGYATPQDLQKHAPDSELWFAIRPNLSFAIPVRVSSRLPLGVAIVRLSTFSES